MRNQEDMSRQWIAQCEFRNECVCVCVCVCVSGRPVKYYTRCKCLQEKKKGRSLLEFEYGSESDVTIEMIWEKKEKSLVDVFFVIKVDICRITEMLLYKHTHTIHTKNDYN